MKTKYDIFYVEKEEEFPDDVYDLHKSFVELSCDWNAEDQGFMLGYLGA